MTEEEKRRLPIPYSFRHLNSEAQQKIKEIYFERNVAFDVKLYNIGIALYVTIISFSLFHSLILDANLLGFSIYQWKSVGKFYKIELLTMNQ